MGRVSKAAWKYRARVLAHAPAAKVAAKIPIPVHIEAVDGDELAAAFDRLATRFHRAASGAST